MSRRPNPYPVVSLLKVLCFRLVTVAALSCLVAGESIAQTIIEAPPQPLPGVLTGDVIANLREGGLVSFTTTVSSGALLNIFGSDARSAYADAGGEIDMFGGQASVLVAKAAGTVLLAGGTVKDQLQVVNGGTATVTGGYAKTLYASGGVLSVEGGAFNALAGAEGASIDMSGYGFRLNGSPLPGLSGVGDSLGLDLVRGDILTGFLASGAPFALMNQIASNSNLREALFTLHQTTEAPQGAGSLVLPGDIAPSFVGPGQTLRVEQTGVVPDNFRAGRGSTVIVNGGSVRTGMQAIGATVIVSGGTLSALQLIDGATLDLSGSGRLDGITDIVSGSSAMLRGGQTGEVRIYTGSTATVAGGAIHSLQPLTGSTFLQTGGEISGIDVYGQARFEGGQYNNLRIAPDGAATLAGGRNGQYLKVQSGSELTFEGAEFLIDGAPIASGAVLPAGATFEQLTGILADGTPFAYSPQNFSEFGGVLRFTETVLPAIGPASIVVDSAASPDGIRSGQVLTVVDGGVLPAGFSAGAGSRLVVSGGQVGRNLKATDAVVEINGGDITDQLAAFHGTQMTISGDANYGWVKVLRDASLTISGGTGAGAWVDLFPGASLTMTDGTVRQSIVARAANVTISGGEFASVSNQGLNLVEGSVATISGGSGGDANVHDSSLNMTGGSLKRLKLSDGAEVVVTGGSIDNFGIDAGGAKTTPVATLTGGDFNEVFLNGGKVVLSGGSIGDYMGMYSGAVDIRGHDFQINGSPVTGIDSPGQSRLVNISENSVFTGVLADGTPFMINTRDETTPAIIRDGVLRLTQTAEASLPAEIVVDGTVAPFGIAGAKRLQLVEGGQLGRNFVAGPGAIVEIQGGAVGSNFEIDRARVAISGGAIGEGMDIFSGGVVTMTGGTVARSLQVHQGGQLTVAGGQLSSAVDIAGLLEMTGGIAQGGLTIRSGGVAHIADGKVVGSLVTKSGSTAEITGGSVNRSIGEGGSALTVRGGLIESSGVVEAGAKFTQTGGSIGQGFLVYPGADFESTGGSLGSSFSVATNAEAKLTGYDFRIDGAPIDGLQNPSVNLDFQPPHGSLFTGKLADGTPFFIVGKSSYNGVFRLQTTTTPPVSGDLTIDTDQSGAGSVFGVGDGRILTLNQGGVLLPRFTVSSGARVIANGGSVGEGLMTQDATIEVNGGALHSLQDFGATTVLVNGGTVGGQLRLQSGSSLLVHGGVVNSVEALSGAAASLEGGRIKQLTPQTGSTIDVRGGAVDRFSVISEATWSGGVVGTLSLGGGSDLTMEISSLSIDGNPVFRGVIPGQIIEIIPGNSPTKIYSGVLADGTPFAIGNLLGDSVNGDVRTGMPSITMVVVNPAASPTPSNRVLRDADAPFWIGAQQRLTVEQGGVVGENFIVGPGAELLVNDGLIGGKVEVNKGSATLRGGVLGVTQGQSLAALSGANVAIEGGQVLGSIRAFGGSRLVISGGLLDGAIQAMSGSSLEIQATEFAFNGQPIQGLVNLGDSLLFGSRGGLLTASLQDGSPFSLYLENSQPTPTTGYSFDSVSSQASLRLRLVAVIPEPTAIALFSVGIAIACPVRRPR